MEKHPIAFGILVDTHENLGLPTLPNALNSAFASTTSGLFTTGAICSALFKKNTLHVVGSAQQGCNYHF